MADARRAALKDKTDISGARALVVEARFYDDIQDALLEGAVAELKAAGHATVPFSLSSNALRDPAASLLKRALRLSHEAASGSSQIWTRDAESDFPLRVDGDEARVKSVGARNWFGVYAVLAAGGPPLVLSVLPSPASTPGLDLFAPAGVLRTLLGYRVSEVIHVPRGAS